MKLRTYLLILIVTMFTIGSSIAQQKDTTAVGNDKEQTAEEEWYESKTMPWAASLIIAFITIFVNLWISYSTRRTSLRVVTSQIESSIKLARVQFQFSLKSKNRQDWINELRNCISEFATHVRQLNILLQREPQDDKIFALHEKAFLYRSKIRLLLNSAKEEHKVFHKTQEDLMDIFEIHLLNSKANIPQFNNQDFIVKLNLPLKSVIGK